MIGGAWRKGKRELELPSQPKRGAEDLSRRTSSWESKLETVMPILFIVVKAGGGYGTTVKKKCLVGGKSFLEKKGNDSGGKDIESGWWDKV